MHHSCNSFQFSSRARLTSLKEIVFARGLAARAPRCADRISGWIGGAARDGKLRTSRHPGTGHNMNKQYLTVSALFLAAWPLFARDKVDVLVMNNGDRLTCEIKGLSSGALYVGLDYVQGTVQVDWSKVHHV